MIDQAYVQAGSSPLEMFRNADVCAAWSSILRGMIVRKNQRRRIQFESAADEFSRKYCRLVHRAFGNQFVDDESPGLVEEQRPNLLPAQMSQAAAQI